MKTATDSYRRDVNYAMGDWVFVRLRPYHQLSVTGVPYNKLSKRYFGPFKVLERIGKVAYRLELPEASRIHPVFHCSLLKPHHGPLPTAQDPLPTASLDHHPFVEPLTILESIFDNTISPPTKMVLGQWLGLSPEDTSWKK